MIAIAALSLFYIAGAQAVHDTGSFQLDGDASSATQPFGPAATDDWDKVCHQANPTACPSGSNTTGATAVSWASDGDPNATIFTGGGSKDPIDISSWAWKDGAGGLPDKDNLLHSFAARYSLPNDPVDVPGGTGNLGNGTACPVGNATPPPPTCDLLFFGSDRLDNSGDAQQGFWFFQKKVTLGNVSSGGGFNFNGVHMNGDILVISDFSNGGTTSTISVYKWNSAVNGNLELLETSTNAKCSSVGAGDAFCGIVNPTTKTMPWSFTDKSGTAGNGALNGEFYEGGINLSTLGLSGECFSSIASETRSSTSTTATLKDFVLGQFAVCGASISTTPSAGVTDQTAVSPGTSVTDTATITGTGTATPPDPTSPPNVVFSICGPTATDATDLCTSGGTTVGASKPLVGGANTKDGIATAVSDAVNTAASPLAPGRYCFRAEWAGDSNYSDALSHSGTGNSECFVVRQIPSSTVTTPSDSSGVALGSSVALGTHLYDKAVVTGTTIGGTPTGSVTFTLCNQSQVTGLPGAEICPSNAGTAVGSAVPLSPVANSSPPAASALSADGGAASTAGVWCFRATYTPTGGTYIGSGDGTHAECVTVNKVGTSTVTTPSGTSPKAVNASVTDHAVVTAAAAGDGTPTGTITFYICNPSQTTGTAGNEVCATGGTQLNAATAAAVAGSDPPASSADSTAVTASSVGTWCFRAEYAPGGANGGNYTGSSDARHSECFLVTDSSSGATLQKWLPNDHVTVSTTGGTALNGSLDITLRAGSCTGTVKYTEPTITLTNAASGSTYDTSNTNVFVNAANNATPYYWSTVFTSSSSLVSGFTKCEHTDITVTD